MHHNDPHIGPVDFLYTCMRDHTLSLAARMEAAVRLGKLGYFQLSSPPRPTLTVYVDPRPNVPIVCPCGRPNCPSAQEIQDIWDAHSPAAQWEIVLAVARLERSNSLGIKQLLSDMDVEGHA